MAVETVNFVKGNCKDVTYSLVQCVSTKLVRISLQRRNTEVGCSIISCWHYTHARNLVYAYLWQPQAFPSADGHDTRTQSLFERIYAHGF